MTDSAMISAQPIDRLAKAKNMLGCTGEVLPSLVKATREVLGGRA